MHESNVIELNRLAESDDLLTELPYSGTRQLIHQAVEAELQECLAQYYSFAAGSISSDIVHEVR